MVPLSLLGSWWLPNIPQCEAAECTILFCHDAGGERKIRGGGGHTLAVGFAGLQEPQRLLEDRPCKRKASLLCGINLKLGEKSNVQNSDLALFSGGWITQSAGGRLCALPALPHSHPPTHPQFYWRSLQHEAECICSTGTKIGSREAS